MKTYALITGATSGIGLATAHTLAANGRNLILLARRTERLQVIATEIKATHAVEVLTFTVDVTNAEQVTQCVTKISEYPLDVLVNNAGLALGKAKMTEYAWEDLQTMIDTNISGFLRIAHALLPQVQPGGTIVNISSIAGIEAYEGGSVYCGTKAFVKMLSKAMRIDLQGTGIRVTDIAPGAVETEFSNVRFKGNDQKADSVYQGYVPLYAQDIADCISFAVSRPAHVNLEYMLVMPTAQASATRCVKER